MHARESNQTSFPLDDLKESIVKKGYPQTIKERTFFGTVMYDNLIMAL